MHNLDRLGNWAKAAITVVTVGTSSACLTTPPSPNPSQPLTEGSIVIREFDDDLLAEFSFAKTIGAILTSAKISDTPATRVALVSSMLATFDRDSETNPISSLMMAMDKRPGERALDPVSLLDQTHSDGLIPIGLFNRLDLAPSEWSDCGEHRIVYSLRDQNPKGRFFLIFEAKLPNAGTGMEGCKPVAERWRSIGGSTDATKRRALLKELYYEGFSGFGPVVDYLNYGGFLGQVRANLFVNSPKWQLREFRVLPVAPNTLVFSPGPVANNPLTEFYKDAGGSQAEQDERSRFHSAFMTTYLPALRAFDEAAPATMSDAEFRQGLMNCLGAPIDPRDNEFQSDSLGGQDEPAAQVGATFHAGIPNWTAMGVNRSINRDQLLNRAGVITCGGCHEFSANKPIGLMAGGGVVWPSPGSPFFFVHVSERKESGGAHVISATLKDVFIPHRIKVLDAVLRGNDPAALCPRPTTMPVANVTQGATSSAPTREEVKAAARQVLQPSAGTSAAPVAVASDAAARVRMLSNQAHAADARKSGAVAPFRRSH